MTIDIIKNRKISFAVSAILFVISLLVLIVVGLNPGIDFTGGSLLEVSFSSERPRLKAVKQTVSMLDFDLNSPVIQPVDQDSYIFKTRFITEQEHQQILSILRQDFETDDNRVLEERVETVGPAISSHLKSRAIYAVVAVVIAIIAYVAYAFRKVAKPIQSWKYGLTAIIALIHDVTITMGVFALLGKFAGVEIDIPFVVALLTILGYSVNDTIVVFDRVRENLIKKGSSQFAQTVALGVNQTLTRSFNTSLTTLIVLFALFIFGGATIHYFSLALIIGIILGTYSSIFLASPLLVVWQEMKYKKLS